MVGLLLGWFAEFILLTVGIFGLIRVTRERLIALVTASSFGLRLLLGQTLFVVSALNLPLLRNLQLDRGFWKFAPDAAGFQAQAAAAAAFFGGGHRPAGVVDQPFAWLLGAFYRLFGVFPPQGLLLVSACAALCVPLAFLAARWAGIQRKPALIGATVVAFWPSSYAWSSQLLKDSILWFALFAVVAGTAGLLHRDAEARASNLSLSATLVIVGEVILIWLRGYMDPVWIASAALGGLVFFTVGPNKRSRKRLAPIAVLLAGILLGAAIPAREAIATFASSVGTSFAAAGSRMNLSSHSASAASAVPDAPPPSSSTQDPTAKRRIDVNADTVASESATADDWAQLADVPVCVVNYFRGAHDRLPVSTRELLQWAYIARDPTLYSQGQWSCTPPPSATRPAGGAALGDTLDTSAVLELGNCPPLNLLLAVRLGFNRTGGATLFDTTAVFPNCLFVGAYVPRALEVVYLAPLPWPWQNAATGRANEVPSSTYSAAAVRFLGAIDALFLWIMFPGLIVGAARGIRTLNPPLLSLVAYLALLGFGLGFAVSNFGTLFRLRLDVILPAVLLACYGWAGLIPWAHSNLLHRRTRAQES